MKVLLLLIGMAGCSLPPAEPPTAASGEGRCETGVLRTEGAEPFVSLILTGEGGETIELVDAQVPRLRQVTGAVVTVCGESPSEGSSELMVASFEIRSVDGNEAYLGVIRSTGSGYVIDSGLGRPEVPLANVPTALEEAEGREVWVAGDWSTEAFLVKSFGIFRSGR